MKNTNTKTLNRSRRHARVRAKVAGTEARPRLSIYKSNKRIIAQIINDDKGLTIVSVDAAKEKGKTPKERAEAAAATLGKLAKSKDISKVVFDRGGFQYIGTVKAFADAARAAGLEF
jgi:large subunit ribosomal protein L18